MDRIYRRELGTTELGFYWDGQFNGTADAIAHLVVHARRGGEDVFGSKNVLRAWIALKQQFPLLGSQIDIFEDTINLLVSENDLGTSHPDEVVFKQASSAQEADAIAEKLIRVEGPRQLSNKLLARMYILHRDDAEGLHHVIFHAAHIVTDAMSNSNVLRVFLDTLSLPIEAPVTDIQKRLAMVVASEDLYPALKLSVPRQRWRRAIGYVLAEIRQAKMQGGQTLPRKITTLTGMTPAVSRHTTVSLSADTSMAVIDRCRQHGLTFGHAFFVLSQIAMSRLLHRRYFRGELSKEEWQYRKRQPMHTGGPLNLRSYLDKDWQDQGGASQALLAISFFFASLPFMPANESLRREQLDNGAPPFDSLMSHARFLARCNMVKRQTIHIIRHPLFLESASARIHLRIDRARSAAMRWREMKKPGVSQTPQEAEIVNEMVGGLVTSHGGSSIGNLDAVLPPEYPLPPSHPLSTRHKTLSFTSSQLTGNPHPETNPLTKGNAPVITIQSSTTLLHCRPTELYLGASTSGKQLHFGIFWDDNVYDEGIVKEWLGEITDATRWYLVGTGEGRICKARL
ncbi:hypothetical protein JAAARDRAFT_191101 [Jaapia argillacea MUCL 33604]|uniref:Condensation domain-containing protein n=1 Tax=Jaapia argillacea MUCL 33604 TaxID=933084 RepID=A0A067QBW6_9AGAM|nr:hypothetical protein JAAARDRAFT_191101 [Jaapia argillacea MUCL 33604]